MSFYGNVEYGDVRLETFMLYGLLKHPENCDCDFCQTLNSKIEEAENNEAVSN